MKSKWRLRIKPIVAMLLSIAMIVSFSGCGSKSNNAQNENETEFQAYYEPLTSDDIVTEGDVYYASSQMLLTSVNDATYEDIEKLIKQNGGEIVGYISATGDYQIRFNDSKTFEELEQLIENLKNDALIEDASLAYVAQFSNEAINYTNDPWIDADDPSDTSGSVWDEDNPDGKNWWAEAIDMPTVWSMDLFTQTVKVGIIDSMFDTTNEDLDENLFAKTWNNPTNDDGSCRVTQLYNDAVAAYDQAVLSKDQNAIDNASNNISNASHGTHVAGIIAAQADNGFGIAGVNQNVKLYGYSVLSDESTVSDEGQWGSIFQYKCAIAHLLNEGVKVINISMGYNDALMGTQDGDSYWSTFTSVNSKSLESFLLKYIEAGNEFLIVKAAGNDSSADKKYDAGNDVFGAISNEQVAQRIIIVGAARYNTKYGYFPIADFSNTGSRVNVYAPGVDVLSDIPSNVTSLMSGTSMSTPVVTGLASLIWGINPDLSAEQVRSFILASTSATMFNLDDESFIIRDLINWVADPTAIVNADICVQLAQATIGNGNNSDAEYGTVSGMVYAITSDGSDFVDINIETLSLYNENGDLVSTVPLQDIAYRVTDDNTGDVSILNLHTYSMLIEPGTYTLKAEVDGYNVQSQQITIHPNDVVSVDFEFTASAPLYSVDCYIPVIEDAIAETAYDSTTGSGFLYDIDSDGVDELVILNVYAEVGGNSFPGHAYSVYDIENGEVIAKCDKEVLFYDVGGPSGYVGVVNYLGSTALVVYIDNGETGYQAQRESLYTIYNTDSLQVIASASIDYVSADTVQVNNCTVNGKPCSYNDYLNVVDAIEPIMIADIYSNDGTDGSMGLYELLRFIQELSGIKPEQSPKITKADAGQIANSVWGEYLKREQGFDWKIFEEESLIKEGVEYYCYTLQTNSKYGATDWSVFYYLFINSLTGEYSNSLYDGFSQVNSTDPSETEQVESTPEIGSDTISEQELLGEWVIDTEYTMEFNDMSMWDFYGTSFSDGGNKMTFGSDGSYKYYVAWCYGNGTFELQNGEIAVNLTDGDPIQGAIKLFVMTDGVTRIALDQYGDGNLIFWIKS